MYGYYNKPNKTGLKPSSRYLRPNTETRPSQQEVSRNDTDLLPPHPYLKKEPQPIQLNKIKEPKNEQDKPVMFHVTCIGQKMWKRFVALPLFTRIVLALLIQYMLFNIVSTLVQALMPSMDLLTSLFEIISSALFIYSFFKQLSKTK